MVVGSNYTMYVQKPSNKTSVMTCQQTISLSRHSILNADKTCTHSVNMAAGRSCFLLVLLMIAIHSQVRAEYSTCQEDTRTSEKGCSKDTKLRFRSKHLNYGDRTKYPNCDAVRIAGYKQRGYYRVWYNSSVHYDVVCHHEDDVSYTMIQQRYNGAISFVGTLSNYKLGFGSQHGDFWAGLNKISYLTSTGNSVLHVLLQDWNYDNRVISYGYFMVTGSMYTMYVHSPYLQNVTDELSAHSGFNFHTFDSPDSQHCATAYKAGWWYINSPTTCATTLLNGRYYPGGTYTPQGYPDGIFWINWHKLNYSLKFTAMYVSTRNDKQISSFPNS